MTAFNSAMSYNLNNALTGVYPDYSIDYASALVARGLLPGALNPQVAMNSTTEVEFSWTNNSNEAKAKGNDKVLLVVLNPAKQLAVTVVGGNTRAEGNQVVSLPENFTGDEVQCYIAFQDEKQTVLSNSVYVGAIALA